MTRPCIWKNRIRRENHDVYENRETPATFHTWSVDYEEFESGPGNFAAAIIELDNGEIYVVPAGSIRFRVKDAEPCSR